jgi:hypothetical protein
LNKPEKANPVMAEVKRNLEKSSVARGDAQKFE